MVYDPQEIRPAGGRTTRETDEGVGSVHRTSAAFSREVTPYLSGPSGDSTVAAHNDGTAANDGAGNNLSARIARKLDPAKDSAKPVSQLINEQVFVDARPQNGEQLQVSDRRSVSDQTSKPPEVVVQYSSAGAPQQKPDFTITKDGTVIAHSDFEKHGGNVVIQVASLGRAFFLASARACGPSHCDAGASLR